MTWDWYTVMSVVSGAVLITMAAWPIPIGILNRLALLVGGGAIAGYGIYVARQTTGTYYFDVRIFILPPILLVWGIGFMIWNRRQEQDMPSTRTGEQRERGTTPTTAAERAAARRRPAPQRQPDPVARQAANLSTALTPAERTALRAGAPVHLADGLDLAPTTDARTGFPSRAVSGSAVRASRAPTGRRPEPTGETAADRAAARRARLRTGGSSARDSD